MNSEIVCLHFQCFNCIQESKICPACDDNSRMNNRKRPIESTCVSCKIKTQIFDVNQYCDHKVCSKCVLNCKLCLKICQGCKKTTNFKHTCANKHMLCRSCSNDKQKCELCLSEETIVSKCFKCKEITYHWKQSEVYVCNLCKNEENFGANKIN